MTKPVSNGALIRKLEGHKIIFLGDEKMGQREGIITDVILTKNEFDVEKGAVVVLWDCDEHLILENGQEIIGFDMGVATYFLTELANKQRFKVI